MIRIAALLFLLSVACPVAADAAPNINTEMMRSVSVTGQCRKQMVPDKASLTMVAVANHPKDLKIAVNEAVKAYESARNKIQALKLKDLETTTSEYNVQPQNDWNNGKQIFRGYQARIGLRVETSEIDRMGEVMALAAESDMKDVGMWQLVISPGKFKQASQDCLAEAALDARVNAEKMANALGAKLGPVISLNQQGAPTPPIVPMMRAMKAEAMAADAVAAPTIDAGSQSIEVMINAIFAIQ